MLRLATTQLVTADVVAWRDGGRPRATLVCRMAFSMDPGIMRAEAGPIPSPDEPPAPRRRESEIVVVGRASPPPGRWHARLRMGTVDRSVPLREAAGGCIVAEALGPRADRWRGGSPPNRERLQREDLSSEVEEYFQLAPREQRLARPLRSDEELLLEGFEAEPLQLATRLPGLSPRAVMRQHDEAPWRPLALAADIMFVDLDARRVVVEWRGELSDEAGMVAVAESDENAELGPQAIATAAVLERTVGHPSAPREPEGAFDTLPGSLPASPPLPFGGTRPAPPPAADASALALDTGTLVGNVQRTSESAPPAPSYLGRPPDVAVPHRWEGAERAPGRGWGGAAAPSAKPVIATARHELEQAALRGVAAASAAAARQAHSEEPAARVGVARQRSPAAPPLELLWFDEALPPILEERSVLEPPPEAKPTPRQRVARALAESELTFLDSLHQRWLEREDPAERPLVCLEAELALLSDPRQRLLAMTATAELLGEGGDKRLREVLARCGRAADNASLPETILEGLARQLLEAFGASSRGLATDFLDTTVARSLVAQRAYLKRTVFGRRCLRTKLEAGGAEVTTYLPETAADELPLMPRFRARLLAEVRPRQEEADRSLCSLAVMALALVVDAGRGSPARMRSSS